MLVTEPAALAKAKGIYAGMVGLMQGLSFRCYKYLMINKVMQNN